MSRDDDDESGDFGPDDIGVELADEEGSAAEGSEAADGPPAEAAEEGAATDEEADEEEADGEEAESEAEPEAAEARPSAPRSDPILRAANTPRAVRLVAPDDRVTDGRLQRTEAAYLVAMRAKQISDFGTVFTDTAGLTDAVAMAFKELLDRRCPLLLRRAVGVGPGGELLVEEWNPREMVLPDIVAPAALGGAAWAPAGGPR